MSSNTNITLNKDTSIVKSIVTATKLVELDNQEIKIEKISRLSSKGVREYYIKNINGEKMT